MQRNFARSLALVLESEGGWSDNAADPGGATMRGVTLATFRRYVQADGTKDDLRHITDAQLASCYRKFYWDAVAGDDLPDGVDYATMDFGVNSGASRAAKYLQAAVGVPQDGTIGPATIAAVKAKPAGVVIDTLCDARLAFLERLPTWGTFGKGWASRVASVRKQALLMTGQGLPPMAQQPVPPPVPTPQPPKVQTPPAGAREPQPLPPKQSGKVAGVIAIIVILSSGVAAFWHHILTAIQGIF